MSVLIKGMNMPKDCRECRLNDFSMYTGDTWCGVSGGVLAKNFKAIGFDGRPDWCPLVEVKTPHGRLTDESVVLEMIRKNMGIKSLEFLYNAEKSVVNQIVHAPTVIDAEAEA